MHVEITSSDRTVAAISQRDLRAAHSPWLSGHLRASREAEDDAQAVLAFLATGMATHAIDLSQALWIIDLAPGDGERAWRVLKHLAARAPRAPAIRYLACCLAADHYASLSAHPCLQPLIASGRLFLDREGNGIPSDRICNPVVVLAHEAFSARPQSLHTVQAGELLEAWCDSDGTIDWRTTGHRDGMMHLLSAYRQSLGSVAFTLPRGGMDTLDALLRSSRGRLLLRASDLGSSEMSQIRNGLLDPASAVGNAGPRLRVNFEALARWHRANGGSVHQLQRDDDGRVLHIALHDVAHGRLQECLPDIVGLPHPDDHVQLLLALESLSTVSAAQCLAVLHAHAGDPRALQALARQIQEAVPTLTGTALVQWRDMLAFCSAQHYPSHDPRCEENRMGSDAQEGIQVLLESLSVALGASHYFSDRNTP